MQSRKEIWFFVIALLILISFVLIFSSSKNVDGSNGGILEGPSHGNGGIDAVIRSNGGKIELEGNEGVINKTSMGMRERISCYGTPAGVASAVNELGGGVQFDKNGYCIIDK